MPGSIQRIVDMLGWSGLEWDEGPHSKCSLETEGKSDGPHGPYIQSHRLQVYQEYVKTLLEVTIEAFNDLETLSLSMLLHS